MSRFLSLSTQFQDRKQYIPIRRRPQGQLRASAKSEKPVTAQLRAHAAVDVRLAAPFYAAFLAHPASTGKDAQAPAPEALDAFLAAMPDTTRARFRETLMTGHYYPQEALTASELLACCKETLSDGT